MPKWLHMWLHMVNFSVMNEPNCSVYKGCRADKWRPQGTTDVVFYCLLLFVSAP